MKCPDRFGKPGVQGRRWIALVAPTVQTYARMPADQAHIIPGIVKEHHVIVGIRAVRRIGKPEILPDYNSVLVARIVELLVAGLPDPVADHVQIHFLVKTDRSVIFIGAVAEIVFAESPVATFREEAAAVDEQLEVAHQIFVGEFSDAGQPFD